MRVLVEDDWVLVTGNFPPLYNTVSGRHASWDVWCVRGRTGTTGAGAGTVHVVRKRSSTTNTYLVYTTYGARAEL